MERLKSLTVIHTYFALSKLYDYTLNNTGDKLHILACTDNRKLFYNDLIHYEICIKTL